MTLGTDKNKILILGGLIVVAIIVLYINVFSGPSVAPDQQRRPAAPGQAPNAAPGRATPVRRASGSRESVGDFHPPFKSTKQEFQVNLSSIDPTLRLDLLAKVQNSSLEGGSRNLFQFEKPPAPPAPPLPKNPVKIAINNPSGAPGLPPATAPPPGPPPLPPITLKYYGYSLRRGENRKQAFFLDGDDILVAYEGQMIKKQYKLVRIGVNSVEVEDIEHKRTQTIPLQEEGAAG